MKDLSSGWCGFGWFIPVVGNPDDESSRESSTQSESDHDAGITSLSFDLVGPHRSSVDVTWEEA